MTLTLDQRMKPLRVAGALDADRDGAGQGRVEVLDRLIVVREATGLHLPRPRVEHRDMLLPGVQVASHECHGVGLLSHCGVIGQNVSTAQPSTRGGPFS